jgi:hypothetical protein
MILRHVFLTWLVAHAIHPFVWMIAFLLMGGADGLSAMPGIVSGCFIALAVSIPAIFFFWLIAKGILRSGIFPGEKLFLWIISSSLTTAINAFAFMKLIPDDPYIKDEEIFLLAIPAIIAIIISVAIRYEHFFQLNKICNPEGERS